MKAKHKFLNNIQPNDPENLVIPIQENENFTESITQKNDQTYEIHQTELLFKNNSYDRSNSKSLFLRGHSYDLFAKEKNNSFKK